MKLSDVWVSSFLLVDVEPERPPLTLPVKHPAVMLVGGKLRGESLQLVVDGNSGERRKALCDMSSNATYTLSTG